MIDGTTLLILGIVLALFGFTLGYFVASTRSSDKDDSGVESASKGGLVEIARFWSGADGKKIYIQMGKRFVHSVEELNVKQREYLSRLVVDMFDWLKLEDKQIERGATQATNFFEKSEDRQAIPRLAVYPEKAQIEAEARSNSKLIDFFARSIRTQESIQSQDKSIAAQIDEILQEKLEGTELAKRGIRLMELPGKDLVVMVGLQQYAGVNEVPDMEIRQVIKAAVAEWEQRMTGG